MRGAILPLFLRKNEEDIKKLALKLLELTKDIPVTKMTAE